MCLVFVYVLCTFCYMNFVGIGFMGRREEGLCLRRVFDMHLLTVRLPCAVDRTLKSSYEPAKWIVICIHLAC